MRRMGECNERDTAREGGKDDAERLRGSTNTNPRRRFENFRGHFAAANLHNTAKKTK